MGEADHTKAMMKQLGDVAFWRIAMRPGRPMAVGRIVMQRKAASRSCSACRATRWR
jgi:molybdopterin molybdotransferase